MRLERRFTDNVRINHEIDQNLIGLPPEAGAYTVNVRAADTLGIGMATSTFVGIMPQINSEDNDNQRNSYQLRGDSQNPFDRITTSAYQIPQKLGKYGNFECLPTKSSGAGLERCTRREALNYVEYASLCKSSIQCSILLPIKCETYIKIKKILFLK